MKTTTDQTNAWTVRDARRLYQISDWGHGYFSIGDSGHVVVRPDGADEGGIDLYEVVEGLRERGLHTPLIVRFADILRHRLSELQEAFAAAMAENSYRGRYVAVFPVKVNQQRQVVEEVLRHGARYDFGVEVGSKPELLAVLSMTADAGDRPIICNGFKDDAYIETVVLAAKLGRNITLVVENLREFERLMTFARRHSVRPSIGVRVKLATAGSGRWSESAGYKSKFGLFATEALHVLDELRDAGMADCLRLLHCHPGSQISDIRALKEAVAELSHMYAELVSLGAGLEVIDLGGGLGVDYDGSESAADSSINYSLAAYASEIVYRVSSVCDERGIPHPVIVTESGRAIAAYHSVLVFDVLGMTGPSHVPPGDLPRPADLDDEPDWPPPIRDLVFAHDLVSPDTLIDAFHDALQAREEAMRLFSLGYLDLTLRALAERLFWSTLERIREAATRADYVPEELGALDRILGETYFCNLSIFQSLPDTWAIEQLFPIMPIHRLDERPTRLGVLADITCDSDGKVDRFITSDGGDPEHLLPLHDLRPGEPYYLAAFLVGAYQETLGDLHNLFGDTHVVHVGLESDGRWSIEELIEGDTAEQVLRYVQYDPAELFAVLRRDCERAVQDGRLTVAEGRALLEFYRSALAGYTYLETPEPPSAAEPPAAP
ncbi:MAG: biosynthetic arginine decarboxylase [Gemmatimonadota bacterium]|nr:biosynthetic arginine decarboxylase [Gemmatimonadota bacterium]